MQKICLICHKTFPMRFKIEGKVRNLSKRKYCLECSPFGQHNSRNQHLLKLHLEAPDCKICPICNITKHKSEFGKKKIRSYCNECRCKYNNERRYKLKKELVEYKGGKCILCGYNKSIKSLDFHHIDPSVKEFGISSSTHGLEKLKKEIEKCILVCKCCHVEIHGGLHPQYATKIIYHENVKTLNRDRKRCAKCEEEKSMDCFYKRAKSKDGRDSWCKECYKKEWLKLHHKRKECALEYKGGRCVRCGYNKCHAALDFHHIHPNEKDFEICGFKGDVETLKKELGKCEILCKNCHGERNGD